MDFTSQNPQSGKSAQSIELRKTFARLAYYCDQSKQGKNHAEILQLLEFSEEDWTYMMSVVITVSALGDFDANIRAANVQETIFIGGTSLVKDNNILIRL